MRLEALAPPVHRWPSKSSGPLVARCYAKDPVVPGRPAVEAWGQVPIHPWGQGPVVWHAPGPSFHTISPPDQCHGRVRSLWASRSTGSYRRGLQPVGIQPGPSPLAAVWNGEHFLPLVGRSGPISRHYETVTRDHSGLFQALCISSSFCEGGGHRVIMFL